MADTKISALPASTTPLAGTEVLPIVQSSSTVQVSVANLTAGRAVATGALTVTGTLTATGDGTIGGTTSIAGVRLNVLGGNINIPADSVLSFGTSGAGPSHITGSDGSSNLRFVTASVIRATINNTGLAVTGLVDISAATSGQIKFPATQNASTNANTLDDYEEGTWTPAPNSGTFSSATGTYTKVGRLVTLTFDFVVGTGGGTTMTNPFTAAITTASAIYVSGQVFAAGRTYATLVVGGGGTDIYLRTCGDNVAFSALTLTASATVTGVAQFTV